MTIVAFGATIDIWNISIYIHMDTNSTASHLWNKTLKLEGGGGGGWRGGGGEFQLLISEITESVLDYPDRHKKKSCIILSLPTYPLNITNNISNQITGIYWPHTKAFYRNKSSHICHQWHSRFCKMLHLDLRPDNMPFGGLQPILHACRGC